MSPRTSTQEHGACSLVQTLAHTHSHTLARMYTAPRTHPATVAGAFLTGLREATRIVHETGGSTACYGSQQLLEATGSGGVAWKGNRGANGVHPSMLSDPAIDAAAVAAAADGVGTDGAVVGGGPVGATDGAVRHGRRAMLNRKVAE